MEALRTNGHGIVLVRYIFIIMLHLSKVDHIIQTVFGPGSNGVPFLYLVVPRSSYLAKASSILGLIPRQAVKTSTLGNCSPFNLVWLIFPFSEVFCLMVRSSRSFHQASKRYHGAGAYPSRPQSRGDHRSRSLSNSREKPSEGDPPIGSSLGTTSVPTAADPSIGVRLSTHLFPSWFFRGEGKLIPSMILKMFSRMCRKDFVNSHLFQ